MIDTQTTPFELNIAEQPDALRHLADSASTELGSLTARSWGRIVITGMGSSHYAGLSTWRRLIDLGHSAWVIDSGELLDNEALITRETLLIVTSQSGASGEVVELLERRRQGRISPALVVGVADDDDSPLAKAADLFLPLHSGPEATVSTKSYLNTLGVHRLLRAAFGAEDTDQIPRHELYDAAAAVQTVIDSVDLTACATTSGGRCIPNLAFIGAGDSAGTALFAALITKESAKIDAEGYVGGQFRHGPFELAGDGLTVMIFSPGRKTPDAGLRRLATDLLETGTHVVVVGDAGSDASSNVPIGGTTDLAFAAASSVVPQPFAVDLARANGVVPGAFVHGSKITSTI